MDNPKDSIPLEIWYCIFEYLKDRDVAALNGLNTYYRDLLDCRLLYCKRIHDRFRNFDNNIVMKANSRAEYFSYWRIFNRWNTYYLVGATNIKLRHNYKCWAVLYNNKEPDTWKCKYISEGGENMDTYLYHDVDERGRCKYCKPLPARLQRDIPSIVPKDWFDPIIDQYLKNNIERIHNRNVYVQPSFDIETYDVDEHPFINQEEEHVMNIGVTTILGDRGYVTMIPRE